MAVGMLQELDGVTADQYDQVRQAMGIADNPPEGLIVHTAGEKEGGMRIFDVWVSAEALERFTNEADASRRAGDGRWRCARAEAAGLRAAQLRQVLEPARSAP